MIPWLEDDPGLLGAEMWANRTLTHAADARRYGVEGLIGIHWRTFETSLSLKALARVAWEPDLTAEQIYTDFAVAAFGKAVGPQAGKILTSVDSFKVGPADLLLDSRRRASRAKQLQHQPASTRLLLLFGL